MSGACAAFAKDGYLAQQTSLKIITWNVNGLRACVPKGLFSFMRLQDPDIFCLQETKAHPHSLPEELRHPDQRLSYWSSAQRKGYSGVVTYLKDPPLQVHHGIGIRKFDHEGRFVVTDHGDFLLYNVYFPNGGASLERHEFKQDFLNRFKSHLVRQMAQGRHIILVGDYNVAYMEHDVYDPIGLAQQSGFLPEERAWFSEFLACGFVDSFRFFHPHQKQKFTWWSYRERARKLHHGWRIDHICVSQGLVSRLLRCEIYDEVMGSDHCPVLLELSLNK